MLKLKIKYIALVVIGLLLWALPAYSQSRRVIVLDPGHGGASTGVQGGSGVVEKDLALRLAGLVKNNLISRYKVTLTRSDDLAVDIDERPGIANHEKAEVFVSIHAAGSSRAVSEGITIFYYSGMHITGSESGPPPLPDLNTAVKPVPWHRNQIPHLAASASLAGRIKNRLSAQPNPMPADVDDAPLRVLSGATMPAVLIEVGYLTNPKEDKRLRNDSHLSSLATRIAFGIDDFLNKMGTISASDLQE
jgi:N-acetylmuramoyl-L-alanine amidase